MPIGVLIVDDHPVVREGLRAVLELRADCRVVGEAADGRAGVDAYARLRPDVVIIDLRLPVMSGIDAIAAIRAMHVDARIIALTSFGGDIGLQRALDAGASGLLLKGASGEEVVKAVRAVGAGHTFVASDAAEELRGGQDAPSLTARERDVLSLMAEGLRNQEIAARLGLSLGTVKVHVNRILEKMDAEDRTEAVMTALRRGVISLA